jgi:hypothetical protein
VVDDVDTGNRIGAGRPILLLSATRMTLCLSDDAAGDEDFVGVEIEKVAVLADPRGADESKVHAEIVDELVGKGADHGSVARSDMASDGHDIDFLASGKAVDDVEIVADHHQLVMMDEMPGDGFSGGADVDEQRGALGDERGGGGSIRVLAAAMPRRSS